MKIFDELELGARFRLAGEGYIYRKDGYAWYSRDKSTYIAHPEMEVILTGAKAAKAVDQAA